MENATKALLIAAGVLFAIMVLSLLLIGYNQISSYYNEKSESTQIEQLAEFNKKFENYNKKNIRGSELLSLMNRVIDYNESQSYTEGTNYKRIGVTITIGNTNIINQFKYNPEDQSIFDGIINASRKITNTTGDPSHTNDKKLTQITSTETILIGMASNANINNLTSTQLQMLSSNIYNIVIKDNYENDITDYYVQTRQKRGQLLKSLLGLNIALDQNAITKSQDRVKMDTIKEITSKYYQYTQFKRAYFDCTKMEYDKDTGRVYEMEFELKTQSGRVIFN